MFIGFDIGGTKSRVVGTRDFKTFINEPVVFETNKDYEEGVAYLSRIIQEVSGDEHIEMIGGGIAGAFDQEKGCLAGGGRNLLGWLEKPFRRALEERFGTKVFIENDAAIVGLGEMHRGAGSKNGIGVYLTVSTGVGGCRYEDGVIDAKALGFEPGAQIIDPDRTLCPDCESGELESYIGGAATERRLKKKPYEIVEPAFWDTYAKYLAYGLNNIITFWSPHFIVLGGSMIVGNPAIPIQNTEKYLREILVTLPHIPDIKKAELGDLGGLYGAMIFLKQKSEVR